VNILSIDGINIFSNSLIVSFAGLFIIGFLLIFGKRLNFAIQLERFGLPIAVICGFTGILIGPYGVFNFLSKETTEIWESSLTPLLCIVFATLMIGRPVPNLKGLIKPICNQFLLALTLGFGQFFVGGLVVEYFLSQSMNINPLMGCLIEVGFEGGHGAASIIGESFTKLGYPEGLDLGLAMATMGLLSSSIIGSIFIFLGRILKIISKESRNENKSQREFNFKFSLVNDLNILLINLGLVGLAISIGIILMRLLRLISNPKERYFFTISGMIATLFSNF